MLPTCFTYSLRENTVAQETALDGIYVIRTNLPAAQMDSAETVRRYKSLAGVERAFRSLKPLGLKIRPIRHRTADRVRGRVLLCMLACYVEWHLREAWRPLLFADEDQAAKLTRELQSGAGGVGAQSRARQGSIRGRLNGAGDGRRATVPRAACGCAGGYRVNATPTGMRRRGA